MIPRFKPQYDLSDWKAALSPSSDAVRQYEAAFAAKFECDHGIMFSLGRAGLYALLETWKLRGAEVICPAYTCVVVPNAIVISGNVPVFVDCQHGSFNMSLDGIRAAITERTRVIVPTHLFGYPMDVHAVADIAEEAEARHGHKVYVVQDCAHSFGARWQLELVTRHGDAAFFGSNISKIINSIFGGMVTTTDDETASGLRSWCDVNFRLTPSVKSTRRLVYFGAVNVAFAPPVYGVVNWLERKGLLNRFVKYYEDDSIDLPRDWDEAPVEIEARVGLNQLRKYDQIIDRRVANAEKLIAALEDRNDITVLPFADGCTYSHLVGIVDDREEWLRRYRARGAQLGELIEYSVPHMAAYRNYARCEYPVSKRYAHATINFPLTSRFSL